MVTGEKAYMHADWYAQVTRKGYLKYLSLSETQELEWYVEYELTMKAAQLLKATNCSSSAISAHMVRKALREVRKSRRLRMLRKREMLSRLRRQPPLKQMMRVGMINNARESLGVTKMYLETRSLIFVWLLVLPVLPPGRSSTMASGMSWLR